MSQGPCALRASGTFWGAGLVPTAVDGAAGAVADVPRELIVRCQGGDPDAFGPIYEQFKGRMHGLALHLLGNRADADEATQEIFLTAWRSVSSFRFEARFSTWLYRLGVNLCLERLRRERRRRTLADGQAEAATPTTELPADKDDLRAHVRAALATLDPAYRTCVILRDLLGLSYVEIAAVLGVPLGTVRSRIARGREALREPLREWKDAAR